MYAFLLRVIYMSAIIGSVVPLAFFGASREGPQGGLKEVINIKSLGAVGDGQTVFDGQMAAGSDVVFSKKGMFTKADKGKIIRVKGAGKNGAPLAAVITSVLSGSKIIVSNPASLSVKNKEINWGTLNTGQIQKAIDLAYLQQKDVYVPAGDFMAAANSATGSHINLKPGMKIYGEGRKSVLRADPRAVNAGYLLTNNTPGGSVTERDQGKNNFIISNLSLVGCTGQDSGLPPGSGYDGGLFISKQGIPFNKVLVENVTLKDFNKEALAVWDGKEAEIKNCTVINCNFDAYDPERVELVNVHDNTARQVMFGIEHEGYRLSQFKNNRFYNIHEYGIKIYSGKEVSITGNYFIADTSVQSKTGQAIGVFLHPTRAGDIGTIRIEGNRIEGFNNTGIGTANVSQDDKKITKLIIKSNVLHKMRDAAINLNNFSADKIGSAEIVNNRISDWLRRQDRNALFFSAIALTNCAGVTITKNRIFNTNKVPGKSLGARNDPLYLENTNDIRFFENDLRGNPSLYSRKLEIQKRGKNTRLQVAKNINME